MDSSYAVAIAWPMFLLAFILKRRCKSDEPAISTEQYMHWPFDRKTVTMQGASLAIRIYSTLSQPPIVFDCRIKAIEAP